MLWMKIFTAENGGTLNKYWKIQCCSNTFRFLLMVMCYRSPVFQWFLFLLLKILRLWCSQAFLINYNLTWRQVGFMKATLIFIQISRVAGRWISPKSIKDQLLESFSLTINKFSYKYLLTETNCFLNLLYATARCNIIFRYDRLYCINAGEWAFGPE